MPVFRSKPKQATEGDRPQKSVQPVVMPAAVPAAAALPAAAPGRLSFDQFSGALGYDLAAPQAGTSQAGAINALAEFLGLGRSGYTDAMVELGGLNEGGSPITAEGIQATPEMLQRLRSGGYTFAVDKSGRHPMATMYDASGAVVGRPFSVGDTGSSFDRIMEKAVPLAIGAVGLGAAATGAGLLGGGSSAAAGGAASGAAGGAAAGGGAASGGLLASVPAEALAALEAAGASLTPAAVTAGALPAAGLPGLASAGGLLAAVPAEALSALETYIAANPVTAAELTATLPSFTTAATTAAPSVFNAAADSQAYNQAAGITGDAAAKAASVPNTVNLGSFTNPAYTGGTMATAGGAQGAANVAAQAIRDATASAELGGGLLSQAGNAVANVIQPAANAVRTGADWMKANPVLGRLAMSGLTGLLSGMGGQSSGAQDAGPSGPPVQWQTGLQQGLLRPVQQYAPPALSQPAGLLAQGFDNAGAWRFLRGG